MKIIASSWFHGVIGIVVTEDDFTGERKARIGLAQLSDEVLDRTFIAENGSTLPVEYLEGLIKVIRDGKKKKV